MSRRVTFSLNVSALSAEEIADLRTVLADALSSYRALRSPPADYAARHYPGDPEAAARVQRRIQMAGSLNNLVRREELAWLTTEDNHSGPRSEREPGPC